MNHIERVKGGEMMKLYNLILASGEGTRLYPLSTSSKPKQFLKLISDEMIVIDTMNRFRFLVDESVVATLEKFEHFLDGEDMVKVITEKEKRETAFTVLNFLSYWVDKKDKSLKDIVIQTPSDHFIDDKEEFDKALKEAIRYAEQGKVVMIGTKAKKAISDYGYIKDGHSMVEKPSVRKAKELIEQGYCWNTAIYVYRVQDMIGHYDRYFDLEVNSFEKAILEKVNNVKVIQGNFVWEDLGTHERLDRLWSSKKLGDGNEGAS